MRLHLISSAVVVYTALATACICYAGVKTTPQKRAILAGWDQGSPVVGFVAGPTGGGFENPTYVYRL